MERKKIILFMLVLTMGLFVLSACSDDETGQEVSEQEQKKESSADLSQFADDHGEIWYDYGVRKLPLEKL